MIHSHTKNLHAICTYDTTDFISFFSRLRTGLRLSRNFTPRDIILRFLSAFLFSVSGDLLRFCVILPDIMFSLFCGTHISSTDLDYLTSFVHPDYSITFSSTYTSASLDSFCVFVVSSAPLRPAHVFVILDDLSILLIDILSVHSSASTFVGSRFLMSGFLVSNGKQFLHYMNCVHSDSKLGAIRDLKVHFQSPVFYFSSSDAFYFRDYRHLILNGSISRLLTTSSFSFSVDVDPTYGSCFTDIYTRSSPTTRLSLLYLHS